MRSLVKADDLKENIIFPTLREGMIYYMKHKKELKGTGILMALYKELPNGKWHGVARD